MVSFIRLMQRRKVDCAAAGWADERRHLVRRNVEVDAEERLLLAVEDADLAGGHLGARGGQGRGASGRSGYP